MTRGKVLAKNLVKKEDKKQGFYQTPYSMTEQLLGFLKIEGKPVILEPCCGGRSIVRALIRKINTPAITFSDKNDIEIIMYRSKILPTRAWCDYETDFLSENYPNFAGGLDWIITNPPYSKADAFIEKSKRMAQNVAMLLPLSYLTGISRYENKIYSDLRYVLVFTRKANLKETVREDGTYDAGMQEYAWFVWERGYMGDPKIIWLNNQPYIRSKKKGDKND